MTDAPAAGAAEPPRDAALIDTGIPTASNTHEVAQAVVPAAHIVYVDNDPVVLAHARSLLASSRQGMTSYQRAAG